MEARAHGWLGEPGWAGEPALARRSVTIRVLPDRSGCGGAPRGGGACARVAGGAGWPALGWWRCERTCGWGRRVAGVGTLEARAHMWLWEPTGCGGCRRAGDTSARCLGGSRVGVTESGLGREGGVHLRTGLGTWTAQVLLTGEQQGLGLAMKSTQNGCRPQAPISLRVSLGSLGWWSKRSGAGQEPPSGARRTGHDMQRGPPRPEPSSEPEMRMTSIPDSSRRALVSTVRS